jgi:hypothetical protein
MHSLALVVPTRIVQELRVTPIEEILAKFFDVGVSIPFARVASCRAPPISEGEPMLASDSSMVKARTTRPRVVS